jgi:hypothetical protein
LLDRPRTGFDVEGVLGDFLRDIWHFCQSPRKHVLTVSEEVDGLTFLFGIQTSPDLHCFGRVSGIDLYGLGVLVHLENAGHQGHGWAEWSYGYLETEIP